MGTPTAVLNPNTHQNLCSKYPRSMAVVSALLLWLAAQILMSIGTVSYTHLLM